MTEVQSKEIILTVPASLSRPEIVLYMTTISEMLGRLHEIEALSFGTYPELSCAVADAYRMSLNNYRVVQQEIVKTQRVFGQTKADTLFEKYPDFVKKLKEQGIKDSKDMKDAFIALDEKCSEVQDRLDMLIAFESIMKDKIDVFIDAGRRMKKILAALDPSSSNKYNTQG